MANGLLERIAFKQIQAQVRARAAQAAII